MFNLRLPFLILSLLVVGNQLFAQTNPVGSISGKLVDQKNAPVSYATVTLLRSDSSVVNGDLSKEDGNFSIAPTGIGKFRLRVESIGFATKMVSVEITEASPAKNLGNISLAATENRLKEVNVVGEKAVMELKVDKKVFNVEKNTTTAGGNATDVLQNVPSVSVDADGTVNLRGKSGVTILIDGKPATMLGSDVNSALQSMPASSIESVEVITNPSAKYDAQGTSGIINIITKKDGRFGINGNVTLGAGTRDKYNGNLGLNLRKGKWNAFLNSSFRLNSTYNNVITARNDKLPDSAGRYLSYYTYEHVPRDFNGTFNTLGVTFDPDKYNSITITENINMMEFMFSDNSDYRIYSQPNQQGSVLLDQERNSTFSGGPFSTSTSVDYKRKFKKKDEELNIDATYANTAMRRYQDYTTIIGPYTIKERAPGIGGNSSFNAWADYVDPLFTKNGKLGLGFKSQLFWFTSTNKSFIDTNSTIERENNTLQASYDYSQQTHAAYVNWSDQVGKFSYQAGLRFEDAIYDGTGKVPDGTPSGTMDTGFHTDFANLFPSAFISYQVSKQQSIYLNYSRRVNRPGFMQLLPFVDRSNPGTVNRGNPGLIPEFIDNIEFSYNRNDNKGNNFIASAYYAYTQNLTQRITRPLTDAEARNYNVPLNTLYTQPINIASGATYGLEGTGHLQLLPIWDATVNANFFQNQLIIGSSPDPAINSLANTSGFAWFGKVNTNLKLPKNFSLQVNANYESPRVIAQGSLSQSYWMDIALRKNFWKNKATLVLNCSDVFKTRLFMTYYDLPAFSESINRVKETRIGNITFTYRFGKSDAAKNGAGGNMGKRGKPDDKGRPVKPSDEDRQKNLKDGDDNDQGGGGGGTPGQQKK